MIRGTQEWKFGLGETLMLGHAQTLWCLRPLVARLPLGVPAPFCEFGQVVSLRCGLIFFFSLSYEWGQLTGSFKDSSWVASWLIIIHAKWFTRNLLKWPKPVVEIFYRFPGVQRVPDHQVHGGFISHSSQYSGCSANVQAWHWLVIKKNLSHSYLFE